MASPNQIVKDAKRSLEIRRNRETKINEELTAAEAANTRVQARLAAAKAAKDKNDGDIKVYQDIVTALSSIADTDESPAEDTEVPADDDVNTVSEGDAEVQPETDTVAEPVADESTEEVSKPRRARRGAQV